MRKLSLREVICPTSHGYDVVRVGLQCMGVWDGSIFRPQIYSSNYFRKLCGGRSHALAIFVVLALGLKTESNQYVFAE